MQIDSALRDHIIAAFAPLNNAAAASAFPAPSALTRELTSIVPPTSAQVATANASVAIARMYSTAAVDIWLRAVHSFLVSGSLTDVSPIWASVSGYYASHYAVRALAHLLGYFQLFTGKRIVRLELKGGRYVCTFHRRSAGDREHKVYWKLVKTDRNFAVDPFFTFNDLSADESDGAHRSMANYADHLPLFPPFRPLDSAALRSRIDKISEIELSAPPIPRVSQFPDLEYVQIIAYHRIVRVRDLLDTILAGDNRFWSVHRNPSWARDYMDFQLTPITTLSSQVGA